MSKAHHLKTRKPGAVTKGLPLNFLLGCSESALGNYELARLAEASDCRSEMILILDRLVEVTALARLAKWFRTCDRQALKHAIENEESPLEWAKRMIRDGQRSEEELELLNFPLPSLPPGAAHLAAALRYQERNIAEGKCSVCPEPLDPNSVRYCTKHLAYQRTRKTKGQPGTADYLYGQGAEDRRGRTPGNLARLEMEREKKTRALLAELGIPPESAAVSLKAAKAALLRVMPDSKAKAIATADLFAAAGIVTPTTGYKALQELLSVGKIERMGKAHPFLYFKSTWRAQPPDMQVG